MNKIQDGYMGVADSHKPLIIATDLHRRAAVSFVHDEVVIRPARGGVLLVGGTELEEIRFRIVPIDEVQRAAEAGLLAAEAHSLAADADPPAAEAHSLAADADPPAAEAHSPAADADLPTAEAKIAPAPPRARTNAADEVFPAVTDQAPLYQGS